MWTTVVILLFVVVFDRSAQISIRRNNIPVDNNNDDDNNYKVDDRWTTTNNNNNNKADDDWIFDNNENNNDDAGNNKTDNNDDNAHNSEDYGIEVVNTTIELLNSTHLNTLRVKIGPPTDASDGDAMTRYDWRAVRELSDHFAGVDAPMALSVGSLLARLKAAAYERAYGGAAARNHFGHDGNGGGVKAAGIKVPAGPKQPLAPFLFEGDIFLSETQAVSILAHVSGDRPAAATRPSRSLSSDGEAIWTAMPLRYRFHDSLEFFAISQILEAIRFWEASTCLRFEHVRERLVNGEDHLEFFKGQGCYSMIGRKGGRQGISIGVGCERTGIIEHEIGHALGLWHEQSRPDAPKYVDVRKEFIIPLYISDFQRRGADEILTLGVPYDYGSVMHYGPTAFSADGFSHTLVTTNPNYQATIGQREQLSFYDVQIINNAYCSNKCVGNGTTCRNGGYPHPNNCSRCICPSGYGGDDCAGHQPSKNAACGGVIRVGFGDWRSIRSPGYEADGYEEDQRCSWVVRAPAGARVLAVFADDFALLCSSICQDFVELKLARDQRTTGARFCCDERPDEQFVSESNQMVVIFRSQASQDRGFHLRLRAADHTHDVTTTQSTTTAAPTTLAGDNIWTEWGPWSACSRSCGGCGIRSRARACRTAECENKSQEFAACNFDACPVSEDCQRLHFFNHVCGRRSDSVSGHDHVRGGVSAPSAVCSDLSARLADCGQPSCCPPFYAHDGRCVGEQSDSAATRIIGELRRRVAALAAPTVTVGRGSRLQRQYRH